MSWLQDALSWLFKYNSAGDAAQAFWMPGAYGADQNMRMTMLTNASNRRNIELQNQQNLAQWQRENEYNDPINQMQRMRNAGLNPALMYGGGSTIAASAPSPVMQGARDVAPQMAGYDSPLDAILKLAQVRNIDASTEETKETTKGKEIDNSVSGMNKSAFEQAFNAGLVTDAQKAGLSKIISDSRIARYAQFEAAWNFAILTGVSLADSYTAGRVGERGVWQSDSDGKETMMLPFEFTEAAYKRAQNLYVGGTDAQIEANKAAKLVAETQAQQKQKDFDIFKSLNDMAKSDNWMERTSARIALLGLFIAEQRFSLPSFNFNIDRKDEK